MSLETVTIFLQWCTLLNGALLLFSVVMFSLVKDLACRIHCAMFNLQPEVFYRSVYLCLGVYKILWIVFFLVPYIAVCLV